MVKKLYIVKVGVFAWCSVEIRVIFGVRLKDEKLVKKQANIHENWNMQNYSRVFWIFLPNVTKIDPYTFEAHCCHMDTAVKHPMPDRVKPSFVIFDIRALWRSVLSARVPGCKKLQMTA